jgi:hypothetical protein
MIGTTRQQPKILAAHRHIFSVNTLIRNSSPRFLLFCWGRIERPDLTRFAGREAIFRRLGLSEVGTLLRVTDPRSALLCSVASQGHWKIREAKMPLAVKLLALSVLGSS